MYASEPFDWFAFLFEGATEAEAEALGKLHREREAIYADIARDKYLDDCADTGRTP